jgi:cyanophycin synthetase
MDLWRLWVLRGPNAWAACPVIEAGVDLGRWAGGPREAEVVGRVKAWLPSLALHASGGGNGCAREGGFGLALLVGRVAVELQTLAGNPVGFVEARARPRAGHFRVAFEYREEAVGKACLLSALEVCRTACEGRPFPIEEELRRLEGLAADERLGGSTLAVVQAARARGIPVDHLHPHDGRYLQLGWGARQRRALASETDEVSAVARSITTDKHLTKLLLRAAGVPVPEGRPVEDADDAWAAACEVGLPVAVKPLDRDLAVGVSLNLRTRDEVVAAYRRAREKSAAILVERFAPGTEHRVLVVGGRVVAVARIEPPHVVGDGRSTVAQLVEGVNRDPRRGVDYRSPLRRLVLDTAARGVLAGQGYGPESVPPAGERVLLRRNPPYIKNGGSLSDLTDRIHPQVAARAVDGARAVGARVVGLDVVAEDIGRPLEEQGGVVVEVNTGPGLWLHTAPWAESPRPVGEAVVATLFPPGSDGRIPVVGVTGGRGVSAAGRHLAGLLGARGSCVGRAGAAGIFLGGREVPMARARAGAKARAVLQSTLVEEAVLEAPARDLLEEGFACDRCDVAVVTEFPVAGADGTAGELVGACGAVLRALAPGGKAVLNADDPATASWALASAKEVVWFSPEGRNPRATVSLREGELVLKREGGEERLPLGPPLAGMDASERLGLVSAVAAGVAQKLNSESIRAYLGSL